MMMIYKDLKKSLIDLEVIIPSLDNAIRNINESHSRSIANPNSVFHNFSVEKLEIAKRCREYLNDVISFLYNLDNGIITETKVFHSPKSLRAKNKLWEYKEAILRAENRLKSVASFAHIEGKEENRLCVLDNIKKLDFVYNNIQGIIY